MDETDAHRADDSGFGLIEVVVSMVLLGIVAMAFFPLLVRATTASATATTLATATQLVSGELERIRATAQPHCPGTGRQVTTAVDARGVELEIAVTSDRCDQGVATYRVEVARRSTPGDLLASGTTLVTVTRW